jgi:hypothetical protein
MPRKDPQSQRPSCRAFRPGFIGLLTAFMLLAATSAAYATSNFYWYGKGGSTCWQTGGLNSPSEACDSVSAGHLATPGGHTGGLEYMSEGGVWTNLTTLSSSGDYCSYARLGSELKYQDSTNEGAISGLSMPTPYSSYQEGDKTSSAYNACQADGTYWGQAVRGPSGKGCTGEACGIGHYVSLRSQGTNDQPWSNAFGEPSLVLSVEAGVTTFSASGSSYGGWGYICPLLEDTEPSFHGVIEYCLQEWRSSHDEAPWKNERLQECGGGGSAQVNTYFWPGTSYATEMSGSTNTFEVGSAGSGHFEAKITPANLVKAAQLINAGCSGWHLSENPAAYALVGVENGLEGYYGVSAMGGWAANLQLRTEYTPSNEQFIYYSSSGSLDESFWNGQEWGFVQLNHPITGSAAVAIGSNKEQYVYYNSNGSLNELFWTGSEWANYNLNHPITGSPVVVTNPNKEQFIYYNSNGSLDESFWNGQEWGFVQLNRAITGSPTAMVGANKQQFVYYDSNGSLNELFWTGSEWANYNLNHPITGSPVVVTNPKEQFIYYDSSGSLDESIWNGQEWGFVQLNHSITESPSAVTVLG